MFAYRENTNGLVHRHINNDLITKRVLLRHQRIKIMQLSNINTTIIQRVLNVQDNAPIKSKIDNKESVPGGLLALDPARKWKQ